MSNTKKHPQKKKAGGAAQKNKVFIVLGGALVVLFAVFFIIKGFTGSATKPDTNNLAEAQQGGDVKITKSEITETAAFIPYDADGTYMELVAVKAPDGTVRTAFNTCQVCYDSGRGYYIQEGSELVCQNCGNRFKISQVEKEKNGCNPIPILEEDKNDDGTTITIPESVIKQYAEYFSRWNKA
jgi:uncharacterized membrane protein